MRSAFAIAFLAVGLAIPAPAQEKTAGGTVVIPSLPGSGRNKEIRIAGQEIANAEMTGPELEVTAQVVQWEEGRSITVRLEDGSTRVVPVPSGMIFPPDLRPGGYATFFVRQTSDGRYRVTGIRSGGGGGAPPAAAQAPAAPPAAGAPPSEAEAAARAIPTPPPSPPKGKGVRGASYLTLRGTLNAYEPGKTLTVTEKDGKVRTVAVAKDAKAPGDLKVGESVVVRVPLQKPFDGRTADEIGRPGPEKPPPPSKFKAAESPKN